MRIYLLAYSLLLFINVSARQNLSVKTKEIDSLLIEVSEKVHSVDPLRALELATETLSESREIDYSRGKAISCFYIGQTLIYLGDYEKSLEYLKLSEREKYSSHNYILRSELSRVKGQVYYYLGLKEASFQEFQKAYDFSVKIQDKKERDRYMSLAYENLSISWNAVRNNPDSAFLYLKKNLDLLEKTDEQLTFRNKINLYSLIGNYYKNQQQYDSASTYYNRSLSLITKYNYPYSSWLYTHWGDLYLQKDDIDSALVYFRTGLDNLRTTHLKNELPTLYQKMSEAFALQGVEDSARVYREKYLQISTELANSRNEATGTAIQILLDEERDYNRKREMNILLFSGSLLLILLTISILLWKRWREKKKIVMEAKEKVTKLEHKLNEAFEEVVELAKNNDIAFLPRFREVYPEFSENLLQKHPDLLNSEIQLCAMMFLNFSSKEIGDYLCITHRSVQTRKSRLRKKLGIPGSIDLYQYINSFTQDN